MDPSFNVTHYTWVFCFANKNAVLRRRTPCFDRAWHFKEYMYCVGVRAGSTAESEIHVCCKMSLVESIAEGVIQCFRPKSYRVHHRDGIFSDQTSLTGRANPMSCYGRLSQGKVDAVPRRECTLSNQISHRFLVSPLVVSVAFDRTAVELIRRERTLSTQTFRWHRKLYVLV